MNTGLLKLQNDNETNYTQKPAFLILEWEKDYLIDRQEMAE